MNDKFSWPPWRWADPRAGSVPRRIRLEPRIDTNSHPSDSCEPGADSVVLDSPCGRLGVAVCYDLRFPELFRHMLDSGLELLALPAAFTAVTGKAHWETLLRARAIENLTYVIAAAQGGHHVNGRETYGDSMIVDPWGSVLARIPQGTGCICRPLARDFQASVRRSFPALEHRRLKWEMSPSHSGETWG